MGWIKHSPYFEEFFGSEPKHCTCPFCQLSDGVEVERVDFDEVNGNLYVVVRLSDGYLAPVRFSQKRFRS